MTGRTIRSALLAIAAWAVLFAPGVAAGHTGDQAIGGVDEVAIAIIAPTFGTDAIATTQPCTDLDRAVARCPSSLGHLPNRPDAGAIAQPSTSVGRARVPADDSDDGRRNSPTRAPPSD